MRVFFSLFIIVHGLLHLPGYARAFRRTTFLGKRATKISPTNGLIWAVAAVLFLLTGTMVLASWEYWWSFSLLSIIVSQYVIVTDWKEAKSGTIVNLVILLITLLVMFNIYRLKVALST